MKRSALLAGCVVACGGSPPPVSSTSVPVPAPVTRCAYDVRVDEAFVLEGELSCDGAPLQRLVINEKASARYLEVFVDGDRLGAVGPAIPLGQARRVRYRIDLAAVAAEVGDYDVAYRSEGTLVTAMSTWLPRPEPVAADVPIEVTLQAPMPVWLPRHLDGDRFTLRRGELHWATYAVFGEVEATRLELPPPPWRAATHPATLTIARVPGRLALAPGVLERWIEQVATRNAEFWGGFPVDDGMVVVIPTAGDGVEYGKVVAAGGAGIVLLVGHDAPEAALYDDWILVHEMFHLGVPSFLREGRWLDEGLATYFEPIIRARAGWYGVDEVWDEWTRNLPLGLDAAQGGGLEEARDFRGVYWGGALVSFLADCQVRERSDGARGLEDGLRAVLAAGGRATQVWRLERVIATVDAALGEPTLEPLARAHAFAGSPLALGEVLAELGVRRRGDTVELLDAAPKRALRESIIRSSAAR